MQAEEPWIDYITSRPAEAGPYEWRVPSVTVPGLVVTFVSHMRMRGAGYKQVLSPSFDYWDGYMVHVPRGAQWRTTPVVCKRHEEVSIGVEGVDVAPCPYCRTVPLWKFSGSDPHRTEWWWLECCRWACTPRMANPVELAEYRNNILKSAAVTPGRKPSHE